MSTEKCENVIFGKRIPKQLTLNFIDKLKHNVSKKVFITIEKLLNLVNLTQNKCKFVAE